MQLNKIRILLLILVWILIIWSYLSPNIIPSDYNSIVHINLLLHANIFVYSIKYFKTQKIPFLFLISFFNMINYGYVLLEIPAQEFQLSTFNYKIMSDLFLVFLVFYLTIIVLLEFNVIIRNNKATTKNIQLTTNLKYSLIVLFALNYVITFPISGMNQIVQFFTLGVFYIGFLTRKNNILENLIFLVLVIVIAIEQLVSGMIFAIVYLGIYMFSIHLIYGLKSYLGNVFIIATTILIIIFSQLFSAVKFDFRKLSSEKETTVEKLRLINDLITEKNQVNNNTIKKQINYQETTFWRLSYQLSALSLVYEKTPRYVPFWNGSTYLAILTKFIPRIIWPDKPLEDMGQQFGHAYKIIRDDDFNTSINTPLFTEGFINFGLGGMYLVGIAFAILIFYLSSGINLKNKFSNDNEILNNILLAQLSVILIQNESNFSMLIGKVLILFFIRFILLRLSSLI